MPCVVRDNYISNGLIEAARATWPREDDGRWHLYDNGKRASKSRWNIPAAVEAILLQLAEIPVKDWLDQKFCCPDISESIFPDLEYLHGAGMHQLNRGATLGLHKDTERHPTLPWCREATAILYLDAQFGDEWGSGELDLTDASGNLQQRIEPMPNRLVLFSTPAQYHRVNWCKSTRRSICLFFWSVCEESFDGERRAKFV